jgi:hypothetical protein
MSSKFYTVSAFLFRSEPSVFLFGIFVFDSLSASAFVFLFLFLFSFLLRVQLGGCVYVELDKFLSYIYLI